MHESKQDRRSPLTAKLPSAALAALCTSTSWLCKRNMIGSSVSLPTSLTSFSVISANARAALRCRSTLSLKESVDKDRSGSPAKKLVSDRSEEARSSRDERQEGSEQEREGTHSRDIGVDLPLHHARCRAAAARKAGSSSAHLRERSQTGEHHSAIEQHT